MSKTIKTNPFIGHIKGLSTYNYNQSWIIQVELNCIMDMQNFIIEY